MDKGIRCNLRSQWELDTWQERTSSLDQALPNRFGREREKKREKERERKRKKELLERKALPSLCIFRRSILRILARQEAKLIPTTRATRGYQYCGVLTTLGGRGFLLLGYFLFKKP